MLRPNSRCLRTRRAGASIVEAMMACTVLAMALIVVASMLGALAQHAHGTRRQALAHAEAANLLERLVAMSWTELTPEAAEKLTLSPVGNTGLPRGKLRASIREVEGAVAAKKLTVEVWASQADEHAQPVRLVTWVYAPAEKQP